MISIMKFYTALCQEIYKKILKLFPRQQKTRLTTIAPLRKCGKKTRLRFAQKQWAHMPGHD
jgi:hypothetical protein